MTSSHADLLRVLGEVRALLARPDNDFSWSSWQDADAALAEIDAAISRISVDGQIPIDLTVLFAPSGPIQEVSLSSGWGYEFVAVAKRFDATLK
ncbi:hypothetical protein [Acrocarpospora catenulata]|uniref:hypothetical protein n=1 Tax=Acrocarpospora catenulata TaxID=2836182 RepID=UPI001BD91C5C|nr:hypothetical protein [Acrocarpospora catenulata]